MRLAKRALIPLGIGILFHRIATPGFPLRNYSEQDQSAVFPLQLYVPKDLTLLPWLACDTAPTGAMSIAEELSRELFPLPDFHWEVYTNGLPPRRSVLVPSTQCFSATQHPYLQDESKGSRPIHQHSRFARRRSTVSPPAIDRLYYTANPRWSHVYKSIDRVKKPRRT